MRKEVGGFVLVAWPICYFEVILGISVKPPGKTYMYIFFLERIKKSLMVCDQSKWLRRQHVDTKLFRDQDHCQRIAFTYRILTLCHILHTTSKFSRMNFASFFFCDSTFARATDKAPVLTIKEESKSGRGKQREMLSCPQVREWFSMVSVHWNLIVLMEVAA